MFAFPNLNVYVIVEFLWFGLISTRVKSNGSEKKVKVIVTQPCLTPFDLMNCSLPGSSVHGILQARILTLVPIPFFRGSSHPRDQTRVSCIAGRFFTIWAPREDKLHGRDATHLIEKPFSKVGTQISTVYQASWHVLNTFLVNPCNIHVQYYFSNFTDYRTEKVETFSVSHS